jgi:hypothetical protein
MDWIPGLGREKSGMLIFRKSIKRIERDFGAVVEPCRELILVSRKIEQLSVPKEEVADVLLTELRSRICAMPEGLLAELTHLFMPEGVSCFGHCLWISCYCPRPMATFS